MWTEINQSEILKTKLSEMNLKVARAYMFLSRNYTSGDRIILLVSSSREIPDYPMKAAEALARHLHEETDPDALEEVMYPGESRMEASTPVHCIGIHAPGKIDSISGWNEELKLRFPSGINSVVCWNTSNAIHQTCFSTFNHDGTILSKEICTSVGGCRFELWIHATKHVIHYQDACIPKWTSRNLVWVRKMASEQPTGEARDVFPLQGMRPFGMYFHELRKYQGLSGLSGDGSMLVWKSVLSRNGLQS